MRSSFTIPGEIVPKPRQTQKDKWAKRPCVERYRAWADEARLTATGNPLKRLETAPFALYAFFHLPVPESLNDQDKAHLWGRICRTRGDCDNMLKSLADSLWEEDKTIAVMTGVKLWVEEGAAPATDVFLLFPTEE